jgi:transcriptional regulator with XRE-family HTH domain
MVGGRIKQLRVERGFSAASLAGKLKINHSSLNSLEKGRYGVSMATLMAMAVHLQCEESDLFTFPGVSIHHDIHEICRRATKADLLDIRSFLTSRSADPLAALQADSDSTRDLVGARIRQLREECGVDRVGLATAIGVDSSSLYDIESARDTISPRKLIATASALQVQESDLLTFPGLSLRHDIHELCRKASRAVLLETKAFASQRVRESIGTSGQG